MGFLSDFCVQLIPVTVRTKQKKLLFLISAPFGNLVEKTLCVLPPETGIGNGFSVDMIVNTLTAFFDIAFNHNALYKAVDIIGAGAAVQNLFYNADLLLILLVGVVVVCVYDAGRILKISGVVKLKKLPEILIMIIWNRDAALIDGTAQDNMSQIVSGGLDVPSPVDKGMTVLCGVDGVQHNGKIAAGRILHSGGNVDSAGNKAVLLILRSALQWLHRKENP